jgi:peptidoglycan/LPS O-acetylase OafA/YrhL
MTSPPHSRRLDVQGLRAVAVVLVVVFHVGAGLPGGFIGVDAFFVISGYVVGSSLFRELSRTKTVALKQFYERRVRRLLPASALASVIALGGSVLCLSPWGPLGWSAKTAVASSLFVSNYYLWWTGGGYFSPADESNPLVHTWSLAVEEQFYLVTPLLLILGSRGSGRPPVLLLWMVVLTSFACSLVLTAGVGPEWLMPTRLAFYGLPTRFWELGVGLLLAARPPRPRSVRLSYALSLLGLGGLVGASVLWHENTPFPGWAALVPTVSTALLISGGEATHPLTRVLSARVPVTIGDASYAWYLWHWPAIVFARAFEAPTWAVAAVAAASFVPAYLSTKLLEDPIRLNATIVRWRAVGLSAACIAIPVLVAGAVGLGARSGLGLARPQEWDGDARLAVRFDCVLDGNEPLPEACTRRVEDPQGRVLLVGDSHAASLSDGLAEVAERLRLDLRMVMRSGCPALLDRAPTNLPSCHDTQNTYIETARTFRPDVVIIANRSTGYTLPTVPQTTQWRTIETRDQRPPRNRSEALASWGEGLSAFTEALRPHTSRVVIFATVPEYPTDFSASITIVHPEATPPSIGMDYVAERRAEVLAVEHDVAAASTGLVAIVDPAHVLCPAGQCTPVDDDGRWLYLDDNHLNPHGSRRVAALLTESLSREARRVVGSPDMPSPDIRALAARAHAKPKR